jgi:two-component system sensor histidine kinase VicK
LIIFFLAWISLEDKSDRTPSPAPRDNTYPPIALSLERTKIIKGAKETGDFIVALIERAFQDRLSSFLDVAVDKNGPIMFPAFYGIVMERLSQKPNFRIRVIADIQEKNLDHVKEMLKAPIEVRHVENNIRKFVVSRTEAIETSHSLENGQPEEIVWSRDPQFVAQLSQIFSLLWNKGIPADERINELDRGVTPRETKVVSGSSAIRQLLSSFVRRAGVSSRETPLVVYGIFRRQATVELEALLEFIPQEMISNSNLKVRCITDIQKDNLDYARTMISKGIEVRHIENNRIGFIASDKEYIGTDSRILESNQNGEGVASRGVTWSNNPETVLQARQIFEALWEPAIPAELRIRQLEEGLELGQTRITLSPEEISKNVDSLVEKTSSEALILLPSEMPIEPNISAFQKLARKAREEGVSVRLLIPVKRISSFDPDEFTERYNIKGIEVRAIDFSQLGLSIEIYDRKDMILSHYIEPEPGLPASEPQQAKAVSAIITTNRETVTSMASVFEALWRERELREREHRSRRRAELLQDILSHDIRNYNQIIRLSAEMLRDGLVDRSQMQFVTESMLKAIDGSTQLVQRAKDFGRVLMEQNPTLYPMNLVQSIENSLALVRNSNPERKIVESRRILFFEGGEEEDKHNAVMVLADEFLDQIFVNLFSNSVKYTTSEEVEIETVVEEDKDSRLSYWKISISDHGQGIPDHLKADVFSRYLRSAKGSGLGMSIVHALVTERYKGKVFLKDRVPGDHTKGTTIEVWLPKA